MKFFVWVFIILGTLGIILSILRIVGISTGFNPGSSIYGLETNEKFSLLAISIKLIIIFKTLTAFGMWFEKRWAIKFGIADAIVGIVICIVMMVIKPIFGFVDGAWNINLRFEILLLIPYLIKCFKIRVLWENTNAKEEFDPSTISIHKNEFNDKKTISTKEKINEEELETENIIDKEDHSRFMPKN